MLSDLERREYAAALYRAEFERKYVPPITDVHPDCGLEDAYAIAQLVAEAKAAAGHRLRGHKIGLTSEVMRRTSGASEPDFGMVFDYHLVPDGAVLHRSSFNRGVAAEIELAFVLRHPLAGPGITAAEVLRATDFILPAIEVVDTRYQRYGAGSVVIDSVADGAWCGAIVLGTTPKRVESFDYAAVTGTLRVNGELCASGTAAAVMGNPAEAVAWLANKLAEFGVTLDEGSVVMSGSFAELVRLRSAGSVVARFTDLGEVRFEMDE
jgi:2-keto-4-pentenoate hydratase